MKLTDALFMPVKLIYPKSGVGIPDFKPLFDSKGKIRMYKSIEALKDYCPENYDLVLEYSHPIMKPIEKD